MILQYEPYHPEIVKISMDELKSIDIKNILDDRLEFMANVFAVIKNNGFSLSETKIIECGSHIIPYPEAMGGLRKDPWKGNVAYFFANYPNLAEYISYDKMVPSPSSFSSLGNLFKEYLDKNKDMFTLNTDEIYENIKTQYTDNFVNLLSESKTDKNVIVCSNEVLDDNNHNSTPKFWKELHGIHIHRFHKAEFDEENHAFKYYYQQISGSNSILPKDLLERMKTVFGLDGLEVKLFNSYKETSDYALLIYENK
jgi:hypothetical protein